MVTGNGALPTPVVATIHGHCSSGYKHFGHGQKNKKENENEKKKKATTTMSLNSVQNQHVLKRRLASVYAEPDLFRKSS